jgi:hypothetical protein
MKGNEMATKSTKQTSKKVASDASKILRDPKSSPAVKRVAASDLAQAAPKKKRS